MSGNAYSEHLAIARTGEQAALRGDHLTALAHYRDAIRLAVASRSPDVFARHYLEATLESLELMGDFESVAEFCERAVAHYEVNPPKHGLAWLDLASIYQRKGIILLKQGKTEPAYATMEVAISTAARAPATLPLCERLLDWHRRGLSVSAERLLAEQRRLRYFSIRHNMDG